MNQCVSQNDVNNIILSDETVNHKEAVSLKLSEEMSWNCILMKKMKLHVTDDYDVMKSDEFLAAMNITDQCSSKWLCFDTILNKNRVHVFADSETSHCYLIKRVVDCLNLKLKISSDSIQLKEEKSILMVEVV